MRTILKEFELDDEPALRSVLMRARQALKRGSRWSWQIKIGGHAWLRGLPDFENKTECVRSGEKWAAKANYRPEWVH